MKTLRRKTLREKFAFCAIMAGKRSFEFISFYAEKPQGPIKHTKCSPMIVKQRSLSRFLLVFDSRNQAQGWIFSIALLCERQAGTPHGWKEIMAWWEGIHNTEREAGHIFHFVFPASGDGTRLKWFSWMCITWVTNGRTDHVIQSFGCPPHIIFCRVSTLFLKFNELQRFDTSLSTSRDLGLIND